MSLHGMLDAMEDHTVLIVEMTGDVGDGKWCGDADTVARMKQELEEEAICSPEEIAEQHIL